NFTQSNSELDLTRPEVQASIKDVVDHHVPISSTLAVAETSVPNRTPFSQRMLDALDPGARDEVLAGRARLAKVNNPLPGKMLRKEMDYEVAFVKAGGILGAGVDPTGYGSALPGFGDQRDYELLVEAGFTAPQAIQIVSANGAKALGGSD